MIKLGIAEMLRYATLRSHVEPEGVFREADPDTGKRPDLIVEKGPLHALDMILDVAVTCPIPGAELRGTVTLTRQAAGVQGRAAKKALDRKMDKYYDLAQQANLALVPFIMESTGYVENHARNFVARVADYASTIRMIPQATLYRFWMKKLSMTLQKALCTAVYRKVMAVTNKRQGRNTGDIPVAELERIHIGHKG